MAKPIEISQKLRNEMNLKHIPPEFQEIFARLREKDAKMSPVTKEIREALISLALDAPELITERVSAELEKRLTTEYLKETLADERARLTEENRSAHEAVKRMQTAQASVKMQEQWLEREKKAVREHEQRVEAREQELQQLEDKVLQIETTEARDRLKLYELFKRDFGNNIRTTQNNTAFIAASGALLAGVSVPMSGDLAKISNKN